MASLADTNTKEGEFTDKPWWKCPCLEQMSRCCCPSKFEEDDDDDRSKKMKYGRRAKSVSVAKGQLDKLKESEGATLRTSRVLPDFLPLTFSPNYVIYQILKDDALGEVPYAITTEVVLLMADVSGFTRLCESYWQKGVTGIEEITKILRGFMSTVSAMLMEFGGDILNFAGDAFFVQFWVDENEERYKMSKVAVQAYKCAVALQTHECLKTKNLDGTLKIKIGIASGEISNWCFGSEGTFLLHVASGAALPRVNRAESLCSPGDIIVNRKVYEIIKSEKYKFTPEILKDGFVKITEYPAAEGTNEPVPDRIQLFQMCDVHHIEKSKLFLIPGLRGLRNPEELQYVSELTTVTVIFIALLNVKEAQAKVDPAVLDKAFKIVLETAKVYEGAFNKMIMFDKGCNFLVIFGLPGLKHTNDSTRSIHCAQEIVDQLKEMNIKASIGISSGTCYCGIVGHPQRQEYTVIGSSVNMAARIMVVYQDQEIAVNSETYHLSRYELDDECFVELPLRKMKGIDNAGTIYAYRKNLARRKQASMTSFHIVEGLNLYGSEGLKANIMNSVKAMANEKRREELKLKNLLPVMIIKGQHESGKNYLSYYTLDCALSLGYKFAACCCVSSFQYEPFWTISQIIRRMLEITMLESRIEREDKLMSYLSYSDHPDLYLLNHLFNCEFPVPDTFTHTDLVRKREKITSLFQALVHESCKAEYTFICIYNADFVDQYSWTVFLRLAEKEKVLILFSLSVDFKEAEKSSSIILLKSFKNINTDPIQEDIFAPALCWNLHVKAVHTTLFVFLKEITGSKIPLLKEISMSRAFFQAIQIVPLDEIDEERLKKEFFVSRFKVLEDEKPMACDLKPGVNLKKAMIPVNVNDTVKESLNALSIQERVLLKQAAVLGPDFDIHSLEAVSSGLERSDVLQSVSTLLSNHIFTSACALENRCEITPVESPTISVDCLTICFCFSVYLRTEITIVEAPKFPIGPYHRLCFRTSFFRSAVLGDMTTEQIYSMRMRAADNLELRSIECATCKSSRTEGLIPPNKKKTIRRYSTIFKDCVCLIERPRIYSEIAMLYSTLGMIFLPLYFKRKAAQAANNLNFPIQALFYIRMLEEKMPQYAMMDEDDFCDEEAFFDPLVLDVSLLKTRAVAFLHLGDHYNALKFACKGLEMLEMDFLSFYGAFKPREFKGVLSKFRLLRAETITKLIPVLARAHLGAFDFYYSRNLLRIEHHALNSFPIDFVQIVNHMATMYKFKYLVNERNTLKNLERNIFRLCRERLRNFDKLIDLTEISALGDAYFTIMRISFVLQRFKKSTETAKTAILILKLHTYQANLPILRIFLAHLYLHLENHEECYIVLLELFEMSIVQWSRKFYALTLCCLAMLVATNGGKIKVDQVYISKCNTFARSWKEETSRVLDKKFAFYISVVMSWWCLYADSNANLFGGKYVFLECYELAKSYQNMIGRFKFDYWTISGLMLLLKMEIRLIKKTYDDIDVELIDIQNELNYLKDKVRIHYPLYLEEYKELSKEYEKSIPELKSVDSLDRLLQTF